MPADINVDDEVKNAATAKVGPKELQQSSDGITGFLRGLLEAFGMGLKNTGLALRDDWTDIQEHNLPHNLMRDLPGLFSTMGQPSVNPTIPALQYRRINPETFEVIKDKVYPGGDALAAYMRSGTANPVAAELYRIWEKAGQVNAPGVK